MQEIELEHPNTDPDKEKLVDKVENMMVYAEPILERFPKFARYNRVSDIIKCMDTIMELAIEADKKYYKKTTLQSIDVQIEILRRYVRISKRRKHISENTYGVWSKKVDELGKMLGGWMKSQGDKNQDKGNS